MSDLSQSSQLAQYRDSLLQGEPLGEAAAMALHTFTDSAALASLASELRDAAHGNIVTYSRKVFIPLTHLCRDVCHYCTFAQTPKKIEQPYLPVDDVLALCHAGAEMGCQEALFTLGERPELRYSTARRALEALGYATTLEYVAAVAERVLEETGLLPHINAGCMDAQEIAALRPFSASMGIMLESASERLCQKGMPHYGSPDKDPARRLQTLHLCGEAAVPFTSGILIGIGETRLERIESLLELRRVHLQHGHLQEVIIQNFRAKPGTLMAAAPEPDLEDLLWTIAVARLIFGGQMSIQAPPNLSPGVLPQLVKAGINDWGGVSPLTPDHVNPEAPWPHLERLAEETAVAGKFLEQRLTVYPAYVRDAERWLDGAVRPAVLRQSDACGFARRDAWVPGEERPVPAIEARLLSRPAETARVSADIRSIVEACGAGNALTEGQVERLFQARGEDFAYVAQSADALRRETNGERVSYVVNRNINYTNVCYFKCQFCAFSKGKASENLRGKPYDISGEEIARRCDEAWSRGATEVCMQGGIHPDYTGQTYLDIVRTVKAATPQMHVHAFSPLEVSQGAHTLGIDIDTFLGRLKEAGLDTLPGTAAEVLHDEVRDVLCPDKLSTAQWFDVIEAAHRQGLPTTATIMYGHIDRPRHWAAHLLGIRRVQERGGLFTEFVPLPFVHMEAPLYLKGRARRGPTFREAVLMHAVARLVLHRQVPNIQASWVKMGREGVAVCLAAGANDLGGSLMNESITRAAGSHHGQEWSPAEMDAHIRRLGREPVMRTTLYGEAPVERQQAARSTLPLRDVDNAPAGKRQRPKLCASTTSGDVLTLFPPTSPASRAFLSKETESDLYASVVLMAACN
ncbi:MAG: bifunctional FO biosynthesis protein CofGH [Halioglobus sp.]